MTAVGLRVDRASDESPLVPQIQTCQAAVSIRSPRRRGAAAAAQVRRWSAACPTILDVIGGLLADCGQIQKLLLDEWVFGRFGKSPILGRLVTQIITPIHMEPRPTTTHPLADSCITANNNH